MVRARPTASRMRARRSLTQRPRLTRAADGGEEEEREEDDDDAYAEPEDDGDGEFTADQLAEIEAMVEATSSKSARTLSMELNDDQRRRCFRLALRWNVRGNAPSAKQVAEGADPRGKLDMAFAARAMIDGHAILSNDFKSAVSALQEELFKLATLVLHMQGDAIGTLGRATFEAPSRGQTTSKNRQMRRMLQRIEPHLMAIWEITDGNNDSLEGFENLLVALIERGQPGSGTLWSQRWTTKKAIAKLHAQPLTRKQLEVERTRHKLWAPSAFNTQERIGHVGAKQWSATRKFMSRQCPGVRFLLAARREGVSLAKLWTPLGTIIEAPEMVEETADTIAIAEAASLARAERMAERAMREREDLRYKSEQEWQNRKARDDEMEVEGEEREVVSDLQAWEGKGIELMRAHLQAAAKARGESTRGHTARAREMWSAAGEADTVFAGATVHHLLLAHADGRLAGVIKVLVSQHEAFVDEVHVGKDFQGLKLSYRLLAAMVKHLQLDDDLLMRLHVEIANAFAMSTYTNSGMTEWGYWDDNNVWHAPEGGVWTDKDGPDDKLHMMMAARAGVVADHASARGRRVLLPTGLKYLHFIDGTLVEQAAEVDWVAKVEAERAAEREKRGPRTEAERLALSCGTLNLVDPLARQLIARSIWNWPLPGSAAASVGFQVSADCGRMKNVDRRFRQVTIVMLILRCWGVKGDGEEWGLAHVQHGMPNAGSCDYAFMLRAWLGDDHAANLLSGLVPYVEMMESLRKTALRIPHLWLMLPPVLYGAPRLLVTKDADGKVSIRLDFPVIKRFPVGRPSDYKKRFTAVAGPEIHAKGMLSMDLSAENELTAQHYGGDPTKNRSSWANEDTHAEQSQIAQIHELPGNMTLKEAVQKQWPKAWEAMLAIVLMLNDRSIDWSDATRRPKMRERPPPPASEATGSSNVFPMAPGRGKRGSKKAPNPKPPPAKKASKGKAAAERAGAAADKSAGASGGAPVERAVEIDAADADASKEYVLPEMRRRAALPPNDPQHFSFDDFVGDVDGNAEGAADARSDGVRLVRWPAISAFGSRSLPDILGGNDAIARKFMGMCILHARMRIPEHMLEMFEQRVRERINAGGSMACVAAFNNLVSSYLKMRHSINKSTDTKKCYPATLDGKDADLLVADWLKLLGVDLAKCAEDGAYPSKYFEGLHAMLVDAGQSEDVLIELPLYAECALHYALAMREGKKMPADLRPDPEPAYVKFEEESRLFITKFRRLGWDLKAYGFHLWANLPTLFRKWGSLEGISQQVVEAMIGKVARIVPHLQMKAVGAYSKAACGCRERELEELESKRLALDAPAERIVEESMMETLEATYGLTPKDKDAQPQRQILLDLDHGIATGNVTEYALFVRYCKRYIQAGRIQRGHARAQVRRAHASGYGAVWSALADEVNDYYAPARHKFGVSSAHTNAEWHASMRDVRKAAWEKMAWRAEPRRAKRLSGASAYQALPYFL